MVSVAGHRVSCARKGVEGCGRNVFVGEVGTELQSAVLVVRNGSQEPPNKRMNNQKTITHPELVAMARERGMKGYQNLRKLGLAEKASNFRSRRGRRKGSRGRHAGSKL